MFYPYMSLPDETEIVHSEIINKAENGEKGNRNQNIGMYVRDILQMSVNVCDYESIDHNQDSESSAEYCISFLHDHLSDSRKSEAT